MREFDKKSYLDHNVIMPIRLTGVTITLALHYLGQYTESIRHKRKTI